MKNNKNTNRWILKFQRKLPRLKILKFHMKLNTILFIGKKTKTNVNE